MQSSKAVEAALQREREAARKYEINSEGRIVALREGPWGPAGTVGGFVESVYNMSHVGDCWVYDNARLEDGATLSGDAALLSKARVGYDAQVYGKAIIADEAEVSGSAIIRGRARVRTFANVSHSVLLEGHAKVTGDAILYGTLELDGGVIRSGAHREGGAVVFGRCDGYSRLVCQIKGVAWVGAGCRWFTLSKAIIHWENHTEDRTEALALLEGAKAIARAKGWQF